MIPQKNADVATVEGFGAEWSRFDQSELSQQELRDLFEAYFAIFPWPHLPAGAEGFDLGCGSGRWAKLVAPRVRRLHCIDPSEALAVAQRNLTAQNNCVFHNSTVDAIPLSDASMDFGYSLGVLHHVPDTQAGITACVRKLKYGAPFLIYLYYSLDNRPWWYRTIWAATDLMRKGISLLPHGMRYVVSQFIALAVYLPLARISLMVERLGGNVRNVPLSAYRNRSFYTMRTDALDRFGTPLEKRFSRKQIEEMMRLAGLNRIEFSSKPPFWCAIGYRENSSERQS